MPELPEVETTVRALNKTVRNLQIKDVWTNYKSIFHEGKSNIKNPLYFKEFKAAVLGERIEGASRRGKNVLLRLASGKTILAHMKMTGHFLYGNYKFTDGAWEPRSENKLRDPMNRFIRLAFSLSNGKTLAFSDMRRFAKVALLDPGIPEKEDDDLSKLGPDALSKNLNFKKFAERLMTRPRRPIKQALMDQEIVAGIGNIYSDEMLWHSAIHPLSPVSKIPQASMKKLFAAMGKILQDAIRLGGDSASDFRRLDGSAGGYQSRHRAYRRTGKKCPKRGCDGTIERIRVGGRSAHFCGKHQKLF
jgi:formamidopyrimidine-DNA glycosylase